MNPLHVAEFEELAAANRDRVYRQMLRLCGNKEDAEDVLIDALLTAYQRIDTLREREAFGRWLTVIGRRLCFHLRSREKIYAAVSLSDSGTDSFELAEEAHSRPDERVLRQELREALQKAIVTLPQELRVVYVMRDLEEKSGEETAKTLGLSVAAMKSRLHRARAMVRSRMDTILL